MGGKYGRTLISGKREIESWNKIVRRTVTDQTLDLTFWRRKVK
jgi:hypothetical protein